MTRLIGGQQISIHVRDGTTFDTRLMEGGTKWIEVVNEDGFGIVTIFFRSPAAMTNFQAAITECAALKDPVEAESPADQEETA